MLPNLPRYTCNHKFAQEMDLGLEFQETNVGV